MKIVTRYYKGKYFSKYLGNIKTYGVYRYV